MNIRFSSKKRYVFLSLFFAFVISIALFVDVIPKQQNLYDLLGSNTLGVDQKILAIKESVLSSKEKNKLITYLQTGKYPYKHSPEASRSVPAPTRLDSDIGFNAQEYNAVALGTAAETSSNMFTWIQKGGTKGGGRTRAITILNTSPQTLLAGSVSGGIWSSQDDGTTWSYRSTGMGNLSISAFAYDTKNPDVVYASTGEYSTKINGNGIFKSTDAGKTWASLLATNTGDVTGDFQFVQQLRISPANQKNIYAATHTGVFSSTDAGGSWSQLTDFPKGVYTDLLVSCAREAPATPSSLSYSPSLSDRLYQGNATVLIVALLALGLFAAFMRWKLFPQAHAPYALVLIVLLAVSSCNSSNSGGSSNSGSSSESPTSKAYAVTCDKSAEDIVFAWHAKEGLYKKTGSAPASKVINYHHDQNDFGNGKIAESYSAPGTMYLVVANEYRGNFDKLYMSTDYFQNNTLRGDASSNSSDFNTRLKKTLTSYVEVAFAKSDGKNCMGETPGTVGQGTYDLFIAVDPWDNQRIWIGGISIFHSADGGQSFALADAGNPNILNYATPNNKIHVDHHTMVFPPDYDGKSITSAYFGNDGGVYKTANARVSVPDALSDAQICMEDKTWVKTQYKNISKGYNAIQFHTGAVHPTMDIQLGGTQDNNSLLFVNGEENWLAGVGDGYSVIISQDTPPQMYYASASGNPLLKYLYTLRDIKAPMPRAEALRIETLRNGIEVARVGKADNTEDALPKGFVDGKYFHSKWVPMPDNSIMYAGHKLWRLTPNPDLDFELEAEFKRKLLAYDGSEPEEEEDDPWKKYFGLTSYKDKTGDKLDLTTINYTVGNVSGKTTGFVVDLLYAPSNPEQMYILADYLNREGAFDRLLLALTLDGKNDTPLSVTRHVPAFSDTENAPSGARFANRLVVDPSNDKIVYALNNSSYQHARLMKSEDGAQTWAIQDKLGKDGKTVPNIHLFDLLIIPGSGSSRQYFLATDLGVMYSNNGTDWSWINSIPMGNVRVTALAYRKTPASVYAFSYGKGLFYTEL